MKSVNFSGCRSSGSGLCQRLCWYNNELQDVFVEVRLGHFHFGDSQYPNPCGCPALLQAVPCFTVLKTWITLDQRPERADDCWFNTLLKVPATFSNFER